MFRLCILFVLGLLTGVALYGVMPVFWWLGFVLVLFFASFLLRNAVVATFLVRSAVVCCGAFLMSFSVDGLEDKLGKDGKVSFENVSRLAYFDRISSQKDWFSDSRKQLSEHFLNAGFKADEYGVVNAMTLGDKSFISTELREVYSKTGASHVLALSGLHLGIIFFVLTYIICGALRLADRGLYRLWLRLPVNGFSNSLINIHPEVDDIRDMASFVTCVFIWIYVFLVGAMPSVVRASTMLSIYTLLVIFGRDRHSISVLSLTALIMLVVSPLSLFDVGFQMSFLAVLGIILFFKEVSGFYYRLFPLFAPDDGEIRSDAYTKQNFLPYRIGNRIMKWLWDAMALSLCAQLFVFPLVVFYFGNIPFLSVFFSPFISLSTIVIVSISMLFLLLQTMVSAGFLPALLASLVAKVLAFSTMCQNRALEYVASLSFSHVDGLHISLPQLIILYLIIGSSLLIIRIMTKK